jgi:hypothetical protein
MRSWRARSACSSTRATTTPCAPRSAASRRAHRRSQPTAPRLTRGRRAQFIWDLNMTIKKEWTPWFMDSGPGCPHGPACKQVAGCAPAPPNPLASRAPPLGPKHSVRAPSTLLAWQVRDALRRAELRHRARRRPPRAHHAAGAPRASSTLPTPACPPALDHRWHLRRRFLSRRPRCVCSRTSWRASGENRGLSPLTGRRSSLGGGQSFDLAEGRVWVAVMGCGPASGAPVACRDARSTREHATAVHARWAWIAPRRTGGN